MTIDRETVAYHAAAHAVLLMEKFNNAADQYGEPHIEIKQYPEMGSGYYIHAIVSLFEAPPVLSFKNREEIVKDVALFLSREAGESVAIGLSAERKAEALKIAGILVRYEVGTSRLFVQATPSQEIEAMARESFDFAVSTLESCKTEFDNLARVFKTCDTLADRSEILSAARTGAAPRKPSGI